ncbi:MAG: CpaD family pilus assembly lipoprotein [Pseudomonadota bacterium]
MSAKKNKLTITLPYMVLALIIVVMMLTGCDLSEPTNLSQNRIQVEEEKFSDSIAVSSMNDAAIHGLASHYTKHGDSPLSLTVTYDPKSKTSNAMHASDAAARLSGDLRAKGVPDVQASILPVKDLGSEMHAMVSYTAYNALAPKDCKTMDGFENQTVNNDKDYRLGCTIDTVFARQIARPKDLKGQATSRTVDGRRMANTVETYRTGVPNEPLVGETASE